MLLTPREIPIRVALSDASRNGYRIAQTVEESSRGAVRPGPATQYPIPRRLALGGRAG